MSNEINSEYMLTTFDNPYNPFEHFEQWFLFDVEKGYNTCSLLARIAQTTDDMGEAEYNNEIDRAIDEIIYYDPFNIYQKIHKNDDITTPEQDIED